MYNDLNMPGDHDNLSMANVQRCRSLYNVMYREMLTGPGTGAAEYRPVGAEQSCNVDTK